MPSLCNSTLSSSPDRDEFQYWSSFSEKPFSCGDRLQVYKGKLNGKGPRRGDFSAVKVFVDQPGTETRCCKEMAKTHTASDWLGRFLAHGQYRPERVKIVQLQMARMDEVSLLNKLFSHNKRRPSSGEWILLEEMVHERGTLVQFVDKYGRMQRERPGSGSGMGLKFHRGSGSHVVAPLCSVSDRELLEAFVHFSHQASGGHLVVCGLEGLQDEQGRVILKTPVIHSQDKAYGETDLGQQGIQAVMNRHVCNRHCRRMLGLQRAISAPGVMHVSPPSSPPLFPKQRRSPSAPFDPDILQESGGLFRRPSVASAPSFELDDFNLDVCQLPMDVFRPRGYYTEELGLLFHLELSKGIPDDPPPPYTEFIEDLM